MKLEVGKYYKDRGGRIVMIVKYEEDEDFYRSVTQCTYTPRGTYFSIGESDYDLIGEVVPVVAYRVKAEQTDTRDFVKSMEGEKGKVYTKFEILPDDYEKFIDMGSWSYYATQVDAGYIDPITGEFVMNENESKKLKLEVGRTYRDGYGELHKIIRNESNSDYPEHVYWSDEGSSYTVEGFWTTIKDASKLNLIEDKFNLIEEVEVETTTTKKEQSKMKYYRTTEKNTEANKDFPVGTIVTLYKDDGTDQPEYKNVNTGETRYLFTDRLEEINVKTMKTVISPASKLVKILEDSGYKVDDDGDWRGDGQTFASVMLYFCGKEPGSPWKWLPEWLEENVVFDSVVESELFNARKFIVDFMKKKRELSHEAYLYQRDIDEIENEWSYEECEKIVGYILSRAGLGFGGLSCPFCIKFTDRCDDCSYGKRHGRCGRDDSDFSKYIRPITRGKYGSELMDFVNNYPGARK